MRLESSRGSKMGVLRIRSHRGGQGIVDRSTQATLPYVLKRRQLSSQGSVKHEVVSCKQ